MMILPELETMVKPVHRLLTGPIRFLDAHALLGLGGGMAISPVIEAFTEYLEGKPRTVPLTKLETLILGILKRSEASQAQLLASVRPETEVQEKFLELYPDSGPLGMIWIGGGVVSDRHPMIKRRKKRDVHIWTDANPVAVESARPINEEMRSKVGEAGAGLSAELILPQDVDALNRSLALLKDAECTHLVISLLGVLYYLDPAQHHEWLMKLQVPEGVKLTFLLNGIGREMSFTARIAMSMENMTCGYHYDQEHIELLWGDRFPEGEIVYTLPRTSPNGIFETWIYHVPGGE